MTNPKTGWVTREWEIETFVNVVNVPGKPVVFNSVKHPFVSEAIFLGGFGTQGTLGGSGAVLAAGAATIIAHDRSIPDQGSISATQAATLAPQQFTAYFAGFAGGTLSSTIGGTLITLALFAIRGR